MGRRGRAYAFATHQCSFPPATPVEYAASTIMVTASRLLAGERWRDAHEGAYLDPVFFGRLTDPSG